MSAENFATATEENSCPYGKNMQNDGKQTEEAMTDASKLADDHIRDMLEKATDGPWQAVRNSAYWEVNPATRKEADPYTVASVCASSPGDPDHLQVHNARLIASAPDLAHLALERGAEIERMQKLVRQIRRVADEWLISRQVGNLDLEQEKGDALWREVRRASAMTAPIEPSADLNTQEEAD